MVEERRWGEGERQNEEHSTVLNRFLCSGFWKRTRKDCNEKLLILQPHEHNRDRARGELCCAQIENTSSGSKARVEQIKLSAGQRDAESCREKVLATLAKNIFCHWIEKKDKEEMTTRLWRTTVTQSTVHSCVNVCQGKLLTPLKQCYLDKLSPLFSRFQSLCS